MKRIWLATAVGAAVVASAAGYVAFAAPFSHPHAAAQDQVQVLRLVAEPSGSVALGRDQQGDLTATFNATGLTPTLAHAVDLDVAGKPVVTFTNLTADGVGAASKVTVTSTSKAAVPAGAVVVLRLSTGADAMSQEPIAVARASAVAQHLVALDIDANGQNLGPLTATAVLDFNAQAQTLTVTLNATGLEPGSAHAAHLHAGSCQAQGGVLFMFQDFTANAQGNIVNQVRTVTGVTSNPDMAQTYFNLHLGDMNQILDAAGNPTPAFRPVLCQNVTTGAQIIG